MRKGDNKQVAVKVIKKLKLSKEELEVVHDEVDIMHKVNFTDTLFAQVLFRLSILTVWSYLRCSRQIRKYTWLLRF